MPRWPSFIRTPSFVPENRSGQEERTSRYDPNREAQLARLLSSGQGQAQNWGTLIGNLAKQFVGQRGLKQQGEYRRQEEAQVKMEQEAQGLQERESLAALMNKAGIDVGADQAGLLAKNPSIMAEFFKRSRPMDPKSPDRKIVKGPDGRNYYADTQERVLSNVPDPEPQDDPNDRTIKGRDGFNYWLTGPRAGERVNPEIEEPVKRLRDPINMVNQDGEVEVAQTQDDVSKWSDLGYQIAGESMITPTRRVKGELQTKLLNSQEQSVRLKRINASMKPKYLEGPYQAKMFLYGKKERFGFGLSKEEKRELKEYTAFKTKTLSKPQRVHQGAHWSGDGRGRSRTAKEGRRESG